MTTTGNPILTVVTVVRNDPHGLARTHQSLESAVAKLDSFDPSAIEWVIVDGSTTLNKAPTVGSLSVDIVFQPPQGIFEAMNHGLDISVGTWILFLNAGDTFAEPMSLEWLLSELESTQALWGFAAVHFRDEQGRALREPSWDYKSHCERLFARGRFPPHQGTVVRKETLKTLGGFDTRYRVAADYHAALRLSKLSEPDIWTWPLAAFDQGGTSSKYWKRAQSEMHQARQEVFRPSGFGAVRERLDSWQMNAYHAVSMTVASIRR